MYVLCPMSSFTCTSVCVWVRPSSEERWGLSIWILGAAPSAQTKHGGSQIILGAIE